MTSTTAPSTRCRRQPPPAPAHGRRRFCGKQQQRWQAEAAGSINKEQKRQAAAATGSRSRGMLPCLDLDGKNWRPCPSPTQSMECPTRILLACYKMQGFSAGISIRLPPCSIISIKSCRKCHETSNVDAKFAGERSAEFARGTKSSIEPSNVARDGYNGGCPYSIIRHTISPFYQHRWTARAPCEPSSPSTLLPSTSPQDNLPSPPLTLPDDHQPSPRPTLAQKIDDNIELNIAEDFDNRPSKKAKNPESGVLEPPPMSPCQHLLQFLSVLNHQFFAFMYNLTFNCYASSCSSELLGSHSHGGNCFC